MPERGRLGGVDVEALDQIDVVLLALGGAVKERGTR
jgi:hypothetical protein